MSVKCENCDQELTDVLFPEDVYALCLLRFEGQPVTADTAKVIGMRSLAPLCLTCRELFVRAGQEALNVRRHDRNLELRIAALRAQLASQVEATQELQRQLDENSSAAEDRDFLEA